MAPLLVTFIPGFHIHVKYRNGVATSSTRKNAGKLIITETNEVALQEFSTLGHGFKMIIYGVLKRSLLVDETPIGLNIFANTLSFLSMKSGAQCVHMYFINKVASKASQLHFIFGISVKELTLHTFQVLLTSQLCINSYGPITKKSQ